MHKFNFPFLGLNLIFSSRLLLLLFNFSVPLFFSFGCCRSSLLRIKKKIEKNFSFAFFAAAAVIFSLFLVGVEEIGRLFRKWMRSWGKFLFGMESCEEKRKKKKQTSVFVRNV
jgi:hypothetical protein